MLPLKFTDGSTASEVTVSTGLSAFGNNTSETRVVWCRIDNTPSAARSMVSQAGGGPSNFAVTATPSINYNRDYTGTDANATATLPNLNGTLGQPFCIAGMLTNGVPSLYGGNLKVPMTLAAAYSVGPTSGTVVLVDKSANPLRFGGFSGAAQGFPGVIWMVAWFNYALALDELRTVQFEPWRMRARALGFWLPGCNGTGRVLDESGNGNHGTITGAVPTGDMLPRVFASRRVA